MRILAVRGQNLASLTQFSINFEEEPIFSSGIFAITGPTGSGKSTILDAICLALYDALPRLSSAESGIMVGKEGDNSEHLKYNDVRSILRHGAANASAEVDFVGQDGRRYSARWEVRRARDRAHGRLQNQKVSLKDLESGVPLGDNKVDTLTLIEKLVGLGFEQFRRAVLLAQGEFDAFVQADSKERAELLERITGTQIYTQISIAAFNRAKQEKQELEMLQAQAGEYHLFSDDECIEHEQQINTHTHELAAADQYKRRLQEAREWFEQRDRLAGRIEEARNQWQSAQQPFDAAEEERNRLDTYKKGLAARSELESAEQERTRVASLEAQIRTLNTKRAAAAVNRDKAHEEHLAATRHSEEKSKAYDEIGPQLDLAKELDATIDERSQQLSRSQKELETLSLAAAMADQQHRAAITEKQELLQGQENDRAWLEEHKAVERLAIRLDDITAQLSTITKVSNEITALVEKAIAARTRLDSALGEQRAAELQLAALDRRIVEIDAALQKLSGEIANENRDALEGQKDAIHSAAVTATAASSAAKAWAEASGSTKAEQEEEDNQNHAAEQASSTVADSSRLLLIEASALEEARRSLELSDATASEQAERLRSKLADGKPCPVCGSLEHPLHEIGETLRRRVEADKRRVAELETSVQRLTREGATATAQQEAAVKAANAANVRKLRAQEILEANAAEWARTITDLRRVVPSAGLSFPFEITLEADPTAVLIVLQKGIAGAESLLNSRLQKLTNAEKQAGKLVSERDQARSNRDKQNKVIGELTTRRTRLEYEITLTEANAAGLQRQKDTAVSLANGILQHIVTDWTSRLDAGPDDFVRFCSESAAEWMRRSERADAVKTELQGLQSQIATLQATAKERSDAVAAAENRHNDTCSSVEACKAERSKVIGGRPHGEVRTEYRLAREAAEVNLRNSAEQLNGCEHALLAAGTELSSAEQQVEAARLAHANAVTNRDKRLVELGVSPDEANDSLRVGEAWIQAEEIRLRQLEDARNSSRTILQEREGALKTHESTGKPSPDPQELTTKLTETQAHIDGLSATLVQARAVQENDRKARERVAELSQLIETRSAGAMLWATLNDLIGSADGARFRRFAQSLTFEQLVLFANQRLSELKPRYELQRAPGSDHLGLQVIDHDMADEVRGVHSLSGGERFLVSLALALGLASMSSNQGVKVESLFIDEGFGALDSASLGIALSVLERLQASGRRIGVISHVDELKERIAVRVDVSPDGNGRSSVRVLAG